jgi:hypothetical protein
MSNFKTGGYCALCLHEKSKCICYDNYMKGSISDVTIKMRKKSKLKGAKRNKLKNNKKLLE